MKYQLAYFEPASESWRYYRKDLQIVGFDSLDEAERAAEELSKGYRGHDVLVMTIHTCFHTDITYPPRDPVYLTHRIDIKTVEP